MHTAECQKETHTTKTLLENLIKYTEFPTHMGTLVFPGQVEQLTLIHYH